MPPQFVTLGMFIIDEFSFLDEDGNPTGKMLSPQIGGAGTYAAVGARIWLDADQVGMVVDRGHDWPSSMQKDLERYGADMWMFRNRPEGKTTRALNSYMGDHRSFDYLTPRIHITPLDLKGTRLAGALRVHLVCSPRRASDIVSEIQDIPDWNPIMIWEPIPDRCIPEELDALVEVLPSIHILSPNADEALTVLSMESPPTKENIEEAAQKFLDYGIGKDGEGAVVIRSGPLGAYVSTTAKGGKWIGAFWTEENPEKVVDVTGAGNSFLGGLGAALSLVEDDVYDATLYASVSASYTIEQEGLPRISMALDGSPLWNGEKPEERLKVMKERYSS